MEIILPRLGFSTGCCGLRVIQSGVTDESESCLGRSLDASDVAVLRFRPPAISLPHALAPSIAVQIFHQKAKRVRAKRAQSYRSSQSYHPIGPRQYLCDSPQCTVKSTLPDRTIPLETQAQVPSLPENGDAGSSEPTAPVSTAAPRGGSDDAGVDENRRWTCNSFVCRGRKSFHGKCLVWRDRSSAKPESCASSGAVGGAPCVEDVEDVTDAAAAAGAGQAGVGSSPAPRAADSAPNQDGASQARESPGIDGKSAGASSGLRRSGSATSVCSASGSETESENDSDGSWLPRNDGDESPSRRRVMGFYQVRASVAVRGQHVLGGCGGSSSRPGDVDG